MSEFDPRWPEGSQDDPGRQGQQPEPGHQGQSGSQPGSPYQPYPGYYGQPAQPGQPGQEYRHGLGDPSRSENGGWAGYTYPGTYSGGGPQGDFGHTSQFGQPDWSQPGGPWQYPNYPQYQRPRRRPLRTVGFALGAIGLSVLIGLGIGRLAWPSGSSGAALSGGNQNFGTTEPPSGSGGTSNTSIDPSAIAAKVDPGLVDINTVLGYQSAEAAGTGIVLTPNGEILTNNHVVEGATSIKVTDIGNHQRYSAHVVGYDRTRDIAVIQLEGASGLKTESLGDSSKVSVGDAVVGIGNAGGAGGKPSAAAGRVTALNQSITASDDSSGASEQLTGLIQTDANIQSGDSGGALVNSGGQVVGVDTAASSGFQFGGGQGGQGNGFGNGDQNGDGSQGQQQGQHQGFAIPINQAITIAHQIVAGTASNTVHVGQSAFLGVSVSDAQGDQGNQGNGGFGQGSGTGQPGALIQDTVPNGPAEQAGLQQDDVITGLNGTTVDSANTLTNLMDQQHPGDKLSIKYLDTTGQQHTATVTPIAGPVG
ncbi:MAG TPA: trypsin-like peptidase domain-containing protein [Pseudonocardiaceae bacterium]|jgi:S1-C subfamily serine protease|nr:trypsin-like peptidase domain-containing protein [Pseudonocardiaceae bacterium]